MFYRKLSAIIWIVFLVIGPLNTVSADNEDVYKTIEWNDLLTQKDYEALLKPDDLSYIADGTEQDELASAFLNTLTQAADTDYQRALNSTAVQAEYDKQKLRIAGFVVPVTVDSDQNITTFFLVPYYGACIHMPPPPPNQIIYSTINKTFKVDDINAPYWVEGTMSTTLTENAIARSAYSMVVSNIELYEE